MRRLRSGFLLRAIEAQMAIAKRRADQCAMVRRGRVGVDVRLEMAAGDTHALHGDLAAALERTDRDATMAKRVRCACNRSVAT